MDLLHRIEWRPGIGDPTIVAWVAVFAYGLAAWLAWQEWGNARGEPVRLISGWGSRC